MIDALRQGAAVSAYSEPRPVRTQYISEFCGSGSERELVREFSWRQQAKGMVGPDVVVEVAVQGSVHCADGEVAAVDGPEPRAQGAVAALDATVDVGTAGREDMEGDAGVAAGGLEFLQDPVAAIDLHRVDGHALQGLVEEVSGGGGAGAGAGLGLDAFGDWALGVELLEGPAVDMHGHVVELDGFAGPL